MAARPARRRLALSAAEALLAALLTAGAARTAAALAAAPASPAAWLAAAYLAAELAFLLWSSRQLDRLCAAPPAAAAPARRAAAMARFPALRPALDLRAFLAAWFCGHSGAIPRGNLEVKKRAARAKKMGFGRRVRGVPRATANRPGYYRPGFFFFSLSSLTLPQELIAYGFHMRALATLSPADAAGVAAFVDTISSVWNIHFPPGKDASLKFMDPHWAPLRPRVDLRPLAAYAAAEGAALAAGAGLFAAGFRRRRAGRFVYWALPPRATSTERAANPTPPIVLLHGIGLGALPYIPLARRLAAAAPAAPLAVLELPAAALRAGALPPPGWDAAAAAAVAAGRALGSEAAGGACLVGHSYGSFAAARAALRHPRDVHSLALLDPVCLLTCHPQLICSFLYPELAAAAAAAGPRGPPPSLKSRALGAFRALCARDVAIAGAFCRDLAWPDLQLWPKDLEELWRGRGGGGGGGNAASNDANKAAGTASEAAAAAALAPPPPRCLIALAGRDDLVPAAAVAAQFAHCAAARVLMFEKLEHGDLILDGAAAGAVAAGVAALVGGR
jgi:pimeloyl-ACP methyl ester carboxylesterase